MFYRFARACSLMRLLCGCSAFSVGAGEREHPCDRCPRSQEWKNIYIAEVRSSNLGSSHPRTAEQLWCERGVNVKMWWCLLVLWGWAVKERKGKEEKGEWRVLPKQFHQNNWRLEVAVSVALDFSAIHDSGILPCRRTRVTGTPASPEKQLRRKEETARKFASVQPKRKKEKKFAHLST